MIEIYTKSYCPYCYSAKALLDSKSASFTEYDVTTDQSKAAEMRQRTGGVTVPQIMINGAPVGGSDDLHDLDATGVLDTLIDAPAVLQGKSHEGARHEAL